MAVRILCVVGARPNFIKIAPILRALSATRGFAARLVHTGQHYDEHMSEVFFRDLDIPPPDVELAVGSSSPATQTAEILQRFEPVLEREQPNAVLVVGDVNSTLACALATVKFHRTEPFHCRFGARTRPLIVHVEAGLRSHDWDMPEEVNRRVTDAVSDLLYVSDPIGMTHLTREGVPEDRCVYVGSVMIDTLLALKGRAAGSPILAKLGLREREYAVVTLHRPSNVDDAGALRAMFATLDEIAHGIPMVFPIHPRTRRRLQSAGITPDPERWTVIDPIGYLDFIRLVAGARVVMTDSGGLQEETTALGVRCVTLRENTERPITIEAGTNILAGTTRAGIIQAFERSLCAPATGRLPPLWDGRSGVRVVEHLASVFALDTAGA